MAYYGRAQSVGEGVTRTNGMGQIYSNIGQMHYLQEQFPEALEYLEKARDCLERNRYRWGLERTEGYLALVCLKMGEEEKARRHYEKGKEISVKIKNPETGRLLAEVEQQLNKLPY